MARILVIDDDKSLLQMMNLMLKRVGHDVIMANNGTEGLRLAKREMPDIAIVDIMMPDISGYDVCRDLRLDPKTQEIPLLILTALSQNEPRYQAEDSGADEFITKPITRDDLVRAVETLLRTGPRNFAPLETTQVEQETETKSDPVKQSQDEGLFKKPEAESDQRQVFQQTAPATLVQTSPLKKTPASVKAPTQDKPTALPLISVMGLTPGTGSTTLAINLAMGLMQHGRVCIVDLDDKGLHVSQQMGIQPQGSWANLASLTPGGDKRLIANALTLSHQSGVAVIAAPQRGEALLPYATMRYVYSVLSEGFKRILADLSSGLNAMSLGTLKDSYQVVLVANNDPRTIASAVENLNMLRQLNLTGNITLIMNRTQPQGLSYDQVSQALGFAPAADVPYESAQASAIESGTPLLMLRPASLFSQTILYVSRQL